MLSLFTSPLFDSWFGSSRYFYYFCDSDLVIESEVPGFSKDDLSAEFTDNVLSVSGKSGYREINDRLTLPRWLFGNDTSVEASVINGILKITFKGVTKIKEKKKTKLLFK